MTGSTWLIVTSEDNFETTCRLGLTIQGVKARHRKKAEAIRPGDGLIYYMTKRQVFCGLAQITSLMFEDDQTIWVCQSNPDTEVYPLRFRIAHAVALPKERQLPVKPWVDQLSYLKKWPAKNWTLGFQGNLHQWPQADFDLIANAIAQVAVEHPVGVLSS